jgi:hypothetical protein
VVSEKAFFVFLVKATRILRAIDGSHRDVSFEKRKSVFHKEVHAQTEERPAALRRLGDDGQAARRRVEGLKRFHPDQPEG